jgi:hypothetical protein
MREADVTYEVQSQVLAPNTPETSSHMTFETSTFKVVAY